MQMSFVHNLVTLWVCATALSFLYLGCVAVYNICLHPLSKFPGPKRWVAFRIFSVISLRSGNLHHRIKDFHDRYGDIVRISPNELSFINEEAIQDIYGVRPGHLNFYLPLIYVQKAPNGVFTMGGNNSEDHLRQRKIIAPAFTERAVKRQEGIVSSYIDLLINGLRKRIETDGGKTVVDVVDWYSWTTFDIIGDLSFGASFDCLKNARFHPFVAEIFNKWKSLSLLGSIRRYPPLDRLTPFFYGSMIQARLDHFEWARQRVEKRMNLEMVRPDFMTEMMKNNDEKTMTVPEVETLAHGIISAGSETTATLLSGATNYLLKYPDTLKRLQDEIRSKFSDDAAIDLASVGNLPYLNAVLEESLRMCTPVGGGLPRTVPTGGDTVCGHFLEEGTEVSFHHWAAYRSSKHFAHPNEFHPERWLNSSDEFSKDKKTSLKPFSIGSHSCAGQNLAWAEMRLILARMVLNFDFAIPEEFGAPLEWDSQKVYILWEKKPNRVQLKIAKF